MIPGAVNNLNYGEAKLLKLCSIDKTSYQEYYYVKDGYVRS